MQRSTALGVLFATLVIGCVACTPKDTNVITTLREATGPRDPNFSMCTNVRLSHLTTACVARPPKWAADNKLAIGPSSVPTLGLTGNRALNPPKAAVFNLGQQIIMVCDNGLNMFPWTPVPCTSSVKPATNLAFPSVRSTKFQSYITTANGAGTVEDLLRGLWHATLALVGHSSASVEDVFNSKSKEHARIHLTQFVMDLTDKSEMAEAVSFFAGFLFGEFGTLLAENTQAPLKEQVGGLLHELLDITLSLLGPDPSAYKSSFLCNVLGVNGKATATGWFLGGKDKLDDMKALVSIAKTLV